MNTKELCKSIEGGTSSAILVVESFQSDKTVGGGVCRAITMYWIYTTAKFDDGFNRFQEDASLETYSSTPTMKTLMKQQSQILSKIDKDNNKIIKNLVDKINKKKIEIVSLKSKNGPKTEVEAEEKILDSWNNRLQRLIGSVRAEAISGSLTDNLVEITMKYKKPIMLKNLHGDPTEYVKSAGFHVVWIHKKGIGDFGHAVAFYNNKDTKKLYFYDANTGLWVLPFSKTKEFLQKYFDKIYEKSYDDNEITLDWLANIDMKDKVKKSIQEAKSIFS